MVGKGKAHPREAETWGFINMGVCGCMFKKGSLLKQKAFHVEISCLDFFL